MKKIVILSNHHSYTYKLRKEIISALINKGYEVTVIQPYGETVHKIKEMGCETVDVEYELRGMNPIKDLKLLRDYHKILKNIKPNLVLSYTIKPNIYGGIACRLLGIPMLPNITGLGTAVENKSFLQKVLINLYKIAFKRVPAIFFQNDSNRMFFYDKNISRAEHVLLPGSGVNLMEYPMRNYPKSDEVNFIFISRIMKEKGIEQYIETAKYIKGKYPLANFHIIGTCDDQKYLKEINELSDSGIVKYHGFQNNISQFLESAHCIIHPTYYPEGMSNVLLEAASSGRPIITTDRSGCREIVEHGETGYIIPIKSSKQLILAVTAFINLDNDKKEKMGLASRKQVEKRFDRNFVVSSYIDEIQKVI